MKRILDRTETVFTPGGAGAGTIAFRGEAPVFENIQLVTNVTRGVVIYQFNSTTKGSAGYNEVTNTLTLDFDTSTHSASDVLQVIVEEQDDTNGFTRVGGIDTRGYPMDLRVNENGHAVIADGQVFRETRIATAVGTVLKVDTTGYGSVVLQLTGTFTGTVTFQASNDETSWASCVAWSTAGAAAPVNTATAVGQWVIPSAGRFIRAQITTAGTGFVVAVATLKQFGAWFPTSSPNIAANSSVNVSQIAGVAPAAEDAAAGSTPMPIGGIVRTALPAATVVAADAIRATFSRSGQIITKEHAPGDLDFVVNTTVTTNTQTAIRGAQGADVRQNVTQIAYQNTNAVATTLTIQDGSTTLLAISVPASMTEPRQLVFPTPLRGTANTALNYLAGTTGASILLNVTGFNSY